jgi:hypothetical protein
MKLWQRLVCAVGAVAFGLHFLMTALYLTPNNPTKPAMNQVTGYVARFFPQNWNFFAPSPIRTNNSVLVQCLERKTDLPKDDAWVDIIEPLWKGHQNARISAYDRLSRTISNPVRNYISAPKDLAPLNELCLLGDKNACERRDKAQKAYREEAVANLVRPVSGYCADLAATTDRSPYPFAAIRIRIAEPPAWAKRFSAPKVTDIKVGTLATVPIRAPHMYRF